MMEASRGCFTVTLGHGSKVLKRAGAESDVHFSDSRPIAGNKRSVRDRLGSNVDSSLLHGSQVNNNRDDDQDMDLHEKLLSIAQPPVNSYDAQQDMPESRENRIMLRFPSTESAGDLPLADSSRSSYSPWTLDQLRRRSPKRVIDTSQGLSPPRNVEELHRRLSNRTYEDVRAVPYMRKAILEAPRPVGMSFVTKPTMPTAPLKPAPPGPSFLYQIPHSSGIVPKPPYSVDMSALKQMGEDDLRELGIPMGPRKKILLALLLRTKQPQA